eukprot:TCONS_00038981-protein
MFKEYLKTLKTLSTDFEAFVDFSTHLIKEVGDNEVFQCKLVLNNDLSNFPEDKMSTNLIPDIQSCENEIALRTTGDGNCLFNCASIMLVGDESISEELRLRTCLELVLNLYFYADHDFLNQQIKTVDGKSYYKVEALYDVVCFSKTSSKIFEQQGFQKALEAEMTKTSFNGQFCGILQIAALSSVIGYPIKLIYPNQNFNLLLLYQGLVLPRIERSEKQLTILWSSTNNCDQDVKYFIANHFVPLIKRREHLSECQSFDSSPGQTPIINFYPHKRKEPPEEFELPFQMDKDWYAKVGRNDLSNVKRYNSRKC